MKVTHLNTFPYGGAGRAAIRIHLALAKANIGSSIIFREGTKESLPNVSHANKVYASKFERIFRKFKMSDSHNEILKGPAPEIVKYYEVFSSLVSDYRVENHLVVQDADIVNLHWIGDYINYPTFFRALNKPLVWTLHDKNPMLGYSHLNISRIKNSQFKKVEENLMRFKAKFLDKGVDLSIVCPSDHIKEFAEKSPIFYNANYYKIYNCIDTNIFRPRDKSFSRDLFGLKKDGLLIGFLNNYEEIYHKGADIFWCSIKDIQQKGIFFACNGRNMNRQGNSYSVGSINDELLMSVFLSACDAIVISSREENLPNIALEAMACGVPVISTPVGGMTEIIINGFNGVLADEISAHSLKIAINNFIDDRLIFESSKIRKFAIDNFSEESQSKKYIDLYNSILKSYNGSNRDIT